MTEKCYIDTVGLEIILNTGIDLTGASPTSIKVRKPDGTETEWAAGIKDNTKLSYVTQSGDLNVPGMYHLQANATLGGFTGPGETVCLKVESRFN